MAIAVDFSARYRLSPDLLVVQRDARTVQLGTEHPRRMLVIDAPPQAATVLAALDGTLSIGEAIARHGGDPRDWQSLLRSMVSENLLITAPRRATHEPEHTGELHTLTHHHGAATAQRVLTARSDAVVVVDGVGRTAETVAGLLASSGVGHVHQRDPAGRPWPGRDAPAAAKDRPASSTAHWLAAPYVRRHRPAAQVRPAVVVLTEPSPPDISRAAALVTSLVPHLPVRATQARIVVGPLVLPGRSACLNCLDKHRQESDPGWHTVADRLRTAPSSAASVPAVAAATVAAEQVLELIDGLHPPAAVGASLERAVNEVRLRRRAWRPHPECGCQRLGSY